MAVERFTFPVLPEPGADGPSPKAPLVIWPECGVTETVRACAEAAHNILRQLSLDRTQVIAFSSPGDGDGKTSLVTVLSPELAKHAAGSILAIDANLRKPDLTAMLRGTANSPAGRRAMIYPTNLPRLSVLPAPAVQGSPPRRLDPALDDELRQGWSLVLLDTPSLAHAEAASMAAGCDGVYLVVRLGHTARRAVADAARLIRASGSRLLGCVVVG